MWDTVKLLFVYLNMYTVQVFCPCDSSDGFVMMLSTFFFFNPSLLDMFNNTVVVFTQAYCAIFCCKVFICSIV